MPEENYSDISCEQIGNFVYIKSDGIVIMIVTAIKKNRTIIRCDNAAWNSLSDEANTVEQMEESARDSVKIWK